MADFFAPMSDIQSDVMKPIDPLLQIEDGYQQGPYQVGLGRFGGFDVDMQNDLGDQTLGAAPVDPLIASDVGTAVVHMFDAAHQFESPALNGMSLGGVSDVMDVFNVARFLFEGR